MRGLPSTGAEVAVGDGEPVPARATADDGTLTVSHGGGIKRYAFARTGPSTDSDGEGVLWLSRDGHTWALTAQPGRHQSRRDRATAGGGDAVVRAPMPGTVVSVLAEAGQRVSAGQRLVIVEAMKMEHTVTAPVDGVVNGLSATAAQQVRMDEALAVIGAEPRHGGS